MSCQVCELAEVGAGRDVYVRIGTGNVRVIGCDTHVKELITLVRYGTKYRDAGPDKVGGINGDSVRETRLRG